MYKLRFILSLLLIFSSVQCGQSVTNESDAYVKIENDTIPHGYFLKDMGINPFSPTLKTTFGISDSCHVKVFITSDAQKDTTIVLFDGLLEPATYIVQWTGKNKLNERADSGLYFIEVEAKPQEKNISYTDEKQIFKEKARFWFQNSQDL